jgi:purine-binding chemotaxis protein CheW
MAKPSKKNNKMQFFDPFADLDSDIVKDVLGPPLASEPDAPEPVAPVAQVELPQSVQMIPPVTELAAVETSEPLVAPPLAMVEPEPELLEAELPEDTPELLDLLISNLDDIGTDDLLNALVAESQDEEEAVQQVLPDEGMAIGPAGFLTALMAEASGQDLAGDLVADDQLFAEGMLEQALQAGLEPLETPVEVVELSDMDLESVLDTPSLPAAEDRDFLEEIVRQIDEEVYQPDRSGDVFGLIQTDSPDAATLKRHVVFSIGTTDYAVPILSVSEVVRPLKITPVPNVPDWVLGVANLRGDIVSVVDLRVFFGQAVPESLPSNRMLVVHTENEDVTTGLIVDRAGGIFDLPQEQIRSPSAPIDDRVTPFMHGVSEINDRLLVVLDLNQLLLSTEMQQFQ